jgi:hypothetical protein
MSKHDPTLDRFDFARLAAEAQADRAEFLKRNCGPPLRIVEVAALAAALGAVLIFGHASGDRRMLDATTRLERTATMLEQASNITPATARDIAVFVGQSEYDCRQVACRSEVEARNRVARTRIERRLETIARLPEITAISHVRTSGRAGE